jgi:hypothetical protein
MQVPMIVGAACCAGTAGSNRLRNKARTHFPQVDLGHTLDVSPARMQTGAVAGGRSMARNFGVPRHIAGPYRTSMWPLLALALIMVGLINVANHLRHW